MGLLLVLLGQAPRALEGGTSGRRHLLGFGREDSEWDESILQEGVEFATPLCAAGTYDHWLSPSSCACPERRMLFILA